MSDLDPEEHPFGETEYKNYDPEQVNTPSEVVEVLDWVAKENAMKGHHREAEVFRDAATCVRDCLVEEQGGGR